MSEKRTNALALGAVLLLCMFTSQLAVADGTEVLPKGRSAVNVGYIFDYFDREFDDAGSDREVGYYLNETDVTDLGEMVIAGELASQGVFLPYPNSDILRYAYTELKGEVKVDIIGFSYAYGVTENLTVGLGFPYFTRAQTDVEFDVRVLPSATAQATPVAPGVSLADVINGMDAKELAQGFLTDLGYYRLDDWSGDPGIGDLKVFAKYRFLNQDHWKAAAGGFVQIPTGEPDDERNVADIRYGSGAYETGAFAMVDLIPWDPMTLNLTGRYVVIWPYDRGVFVLDPNDPVFGDKFYQEEFATLHVNGEYDKGDYYELETEYSWEVYKGVTPFVGYVYKQTQSDKIDGDVMPKTIEIERKLFYGLTASSVPYYQDGKVKLPMSLSVYNEPVLTGKNVEKTNRFYFMTTFYF